jgi:uncharacterized protein YgiM (DUF1202 family)
MAKHKYFVFKEEGGGKLRLDFRSWAVVIVIGVLLTLLSIIDRGGVDAVRSAVAGTTCSFTVTGDEVNVRSDATSTSVPVQKLGKGATITATTTVTNGFRQLADGTWVLDGYLTPVPGTTCG